MKSTKKSLLLSTISLVLCFAMLLGTTWAWFTDEVTSGSNRIVAGNLDIEVEYSKTGGTNDWHDLQGSPSLFTGALWEPGHTEVVYLRVKNAGTLALKYDLKVSPISETGGINQAGASFKLSDYIKFGTISAETLTTYTRDAARTAVGAGVALNSGLRQSGEMQPKAAGAADLPTKYVTLVVYMPEEVGNAANYKTGTTAPEIDLGITVLATQLSSESDSFGNTYDDGLTNDISVVYNYFPQITKSATLKKTGDTVTATGAEVNGGEVTIKSAVKVNEVTGVEADAGKEFASVQLPVATVNALLNDNNDHIIALNVKKDDTANANFKTQEGAPNLTDKETTTYEVNVTKDGEKVSNTDNLYTVKMFIGENKKNLVMYHNNTEMNKVTGTPVVNNNYNYDSANGYVTMCVNSFSPFTSVYDEPVAAIGTKVYYSLESAIAAAQNGETVALLKDIAVTAPVDVAKKITLNLNGKTISEGSGYAPVDIGLLAVKRGGDLTLTGNGKVVSTTAYSAINMTRGNSNSTYADPDPNTGYLAKLTVENGEIVGLYYGIAGNGSRHNTEIIINGGTFKGTCTNDNYAIYHPQNGTLTINGGTFEGYNAAIELRGGTLTINNGSFTSYATPTTVQPNGSGTTTAGAAIAVAQHTTKLSINVVINGGTFTGHTALNETNPQNNSAADVAKIQMEVKGGTFNGTANAVSSVDCKNFITGGTFSDLASVIPYVADTATIKLAKDAAGPGLMTADGGQTKNSLTIDFNGHTYTMNNPAAGSTGTPTQAMHWGNSTASITLKNGTFKVAEGADQVKMGVQNYVTFNAENMVFDFTNINVVYYGTYTGDDAKYNGKERIMFANNPSSTLNMKNSTVKMPENAKYGVGIEGATLTLDNTKIEGSVSFNATNGSVTFNNGSSATKGVVPYFDTIEVNESNGTYTAAQKQTN